MGKRQLLNSNRVAITGVLSKCCERAILRMKPVAMLLSYQPFHATNLLDWDQRGTSPKIRMGLQYLILVVLSPYFSKSRNFDVLVLNLQYFKPKNI